MAFELRQMRHDADCPIVRLWIAPYGRVRLIGQSDFCRRRTRASEVFLWEPVERILCAVEQISVSLIDARGFFARDGVSSQETRLLLEMFRSFVAD